MEAADGTFYEMMEIVGSDFLADSSILVDAKMPRTYPNMFRVWVFQRLPPDQSLSSTLVLYRSGRTQT